MRQSMAENRAMVKAVRQMKAAYQSDVLLKLMFFDVNKAEGLGQGCSPKPHLGFKRSDWRLPFSLAQG
jgi:hypothetical protein